MLSTFSKYLAALVIVAGCGTPDKDEKKAAGTGSQTASGSGSPNVPATPAGSGSPVATTSGSGSAAGSSSGSAAASGSGSAAPTASGSGSGGVSSGSESPSGSEDEAGVTEPPPADEMPAAVTDPEAFRYAALGDSITRAFNAISLFGEDLTVSYATGTADLAKNASHYARLRNVAKLSKVSVLNEAVVGARAEDLASQVEGVIAFKPDYVTLLIGANDLCRWPDDPTDELVAFGEDLGAALDGLIAANAKVRINLLGVPDVARLYDVMQSDASCRSTWSFVPFCPKLLSDGLTEADRAAFRVRWQSMNAKVEALASARAGNVRFAPGVSASSFTKAEISTIDCFHPSAAGHAHLAEKSFDEALVKEAVAAKSGAD